MWESKEHELHDHSLYHEGHAMCNIEGSNTMVAKIVAALNFYEQHTTEHPCVVCGNKTDTIPALKHKERSHICRDPDACVQRYEQQMSEQGYGPF